MEEYLVGLVVENEVKYDFSKIKLQNIMGQPIANAEVHKTVGNLIYRATKDLGMVETAMAIYAGGEVELDKTEVAEIERLIDDPSSSVAAFARKAVHDYIDKVKEPKSKTE